MRVYNEAGVLTARKGFYKGKEVTVTHRGSASGMLWLEDFPEPNTKPPLYGMWVPRESVTFKE